ncbi:MAG: thiol-disulfide oxidoreductase, partial [Eudoraea sp.]
GVYEIIAKNRYKWFGKQDACMIPTPELKSKFLE